MLADDLIPAFLDTLSALTLDSKRGPKNSAMTRTPGRQSEFTMCAACRLPSSNCSWGVRRPGVSHGALLTNRFGPRKRRKKVGMSASIHIGDLTPEQQKQLGARMPRQTDFTKEEMRSWALKVLASMAGLVPLRAGSCAQAGDQGQRGLITGFLWRRGWSLLSQFFLTSHFHQPRIGLFAAAGARLM